MRRAARVTLRDMSALPRFFLLSMIAGLALWATGAPPPFPLLGAFIVTASALGLALSSAYVHAYMPRQWREKSAALRRMWRMLST